jgi:6-phosphogluconolactonase
MTRRLVTLICLVVFGSVAGMSGREAMADDRLIFVSAFAAGEEGAIHAYRLDVESGRLMPVHRNGDVEHPFFLALSPDSKFLYSIHSPGSFGGDADEQIAAYRIDADSGRLKLLNRQSSRGTASCYLDVDETGRAIVVANYSSGSVASLPLADDGSLGEPVSFIQHEGSSVDPARQQEPHAHCFVISPDNRFALAADLGLDQVLVYRLDPKTAKLTPHDPPFVRTPLAAGPRHLTFHPNGRHVYVIDELANSITVFDYETEAGRLKVQQTISTVPDDFDGTSHCADLKITPDGKFLYGTNRGHDSIAAYRIDDDGRLSLLEIHPSLGKGPQNLAITPGGELLICANMAGSNIALFRIDAQTGSLTSAGKPIEQTSPSCIMIP